MSGSIKVFNEENIRDQQLLFEQYKCMLDTSENLINRRHTMNSFFLAANGFIISALGILPTFTNNLSFIYLCCIGGAGILLCISWRSLLISYGQLNKGKYSVILELEKKLPANIFFAEWKFLGEGNDKKRYRSFTNSEKKIPLIIGVLYLIFIVGVLVFNITQN